MKFRKMHGLGNHFVVLDGRVETLALTSEIVSKIGDPYFGVGFDQLVVIEDDIEANAKLTFWNSDGSQAGACGNATRCCADIIMKETGLSDISLRTERGLLKAVQAGDLISVNMGHPQLDWQDIPLAQNVDIDALPLEGAPMAVGMGNPHCVFFVDDADGVDVAQQGVKFEHDPLYPERTNVEFISQIGVDHLRMRVWERGGMITKACGSGTCAAVVAANRRGLVGEKVRVALDGGELLIEIKDDGVWMTGPVAYVFDGEFDQGFLS